MQLNPDIVKIWRINFSISLVFTTLFVFLMEYIFLSDVIESKFYLTGMLTFLVFLLNLLRILIFPKLMYKNWDFEIAEREIYIKRGIFTHIKTLVPFNRIQHLDVQQSFIDRSFELSKLVIYTAGTKDGAIYIPGLPLHYAEELRDYLKQFVLEEAI